MLQNNDTIFSGAEFTETEATPQQGFATRLFDFAIDMFFLFLIFKLTPLNILVKMENISTLSVPIVILFTVTVYRFMFLLLFNKTIGMMVCKVKLLKKDCQPLSNKEKLISVFRTRFSQIKYYKDK
jgi:uncharacterized RDD family membrane protein YckC